MKKLEKLEKIMVVIAMIACLAIIGGVYLYTQNSLIASTIIIIIGGLVFISATSIFKTNNFDIALMRWHDMENKYKDQIDELKSNVVSSHDLADKLLKDVERLEGEKKVLLDKSRTICIHCHKPMFF